ncbi:hypothetical protein GTA08_BOTSDO09812 [Neofusicoccum parvum]|nr:hypothetical protein GTA08_BOTSDO09812 [Neofusicoccum parvum]
MDGNHRSNITHINPADLNPVDHAQAQLLLTDDQEYRQYHSLDDQVLAGNVTAPSGNLLRAYDLNTASIPAATPRRDQWMYAQHHSSPPARPSSPPDSEYTSLTRELQQAIDDGIDRPRTPPNATYFPPFPPPALPTRPTPNQSATEPPSSPSPSSTTSSTIAVRPATPTHDLLPHWTRLLAHPPATAFHTRTGALKRSWPLAAFSSTHVRLRDSLLKRTSAMHAAGPAALNVTAAFWRWLTEHRAPAPGPGVAARQRVRCDEVFAAAAAHAGMAEGEGGDARCGDNHAEWEFWMCARCWGAQAGWLVGRAREVWERGLAVPFCEGCAERVVRECGRGVNGCVCDDGPRCLEHRVGHLEELGRRFDAHFQAHHGPAGTVGVGAEGGASQQAREVAYCACGAQPVSVDLAEAFFCAGCEKVVTLPLAEDPVWRVGGETVKPWFAAMMAQRTQAGWNPRT